MFTIETEGHWRGDPARYCGRLVVTAEEQEDAELLAALAQVMYVHEARARLLTALKTLGPELTAELLEAATGAVADPAKRDRLMALTRDVNSVRNEPVAFVSS